MEDDENPSLAAPVGESPVPAVVARTRDQARDQARGRRKRSVRARIISVKRMTLREIEEGRRYLRVVEAEGPLPQRPKTRGDCAGVPRPCPFVSCKWSLYLDVGESRAIKLNFPDIEPDEMPANASCALDVADEGGKTLEQVAAFTNLTRERIRQFEMKAREKMTQDAPAKVVRELEAVWSDGAVLRKVRLNAGECPPEAEAAPDVDDDEHAALSFKQGLDKAAYVRQWGACAVCGAEVRLDPNGRYAIDHAEPASSPGVVRRVCSGARQPPAVAGKRVDVVDRSRPGSAWRGGMTVVGKPMGLAEREGRKLKLWDNARGGRSTPKEVHEARERDVLLAVRDLGKGGAYNPSGRVAAVVGAGVGQVMGYLASLHAKGALEMKPGVGYRVAPGSVVFVHDGAAPIDVEDRHVTVEGPIEKGPCGDATEITNAAELARVFDATDDRITEMYADKKRPRPVRDFVGEDDDCEQTRSVLTPKGPKQEEKAMTKWKGKHEWSATSYVDRAHAIDEARTELVRRGIEQPSQREIGELLGKDQVTVSKTLRMVAAGIEEIGKPRAPAKKHKPCAKAVVDVRAKAKADPPKSTNGHAGHANGNGKSTALAVRRDSPNATIIERMKDDQVLRMLVAKWREACDASDRMLRAIDAYVGDPSEP